MASFLYTLTLSCSLLFFAHPFYVSICEINHNSETASLEITLKLFTSDLEDCLEKNGAPNLQIGTKKESEETNEILKTYINESLHIQINEKEVIPIYLGKEVEDEVTWIYLEAKKIKKVESIQIKNSLLFEFEDSQTNIIHIFANDEKKSMLLNRSNDEDKVTY